MHVHLVRSNELPIFKFNSISEYLNEFKGEIKFCSEIEEENENEVEEYENDPFLQKFTTGDYEPQDENDFLRFFEKCDNYRQKKSIPNNELVILLTNERNTSNFFGYVSKDMKNVFIQVSEWKNILGDGLEDETLPVVYEICAWTLRFLLFRHIGEMKIHIPSKTFGCVMDMCLDKKDFSFKIRTGDIRPEVMELIGKRNIKPSYINQLISIFEKIRSGVLFRQRVGMTEQLTRIKLIEVGNKFKFSLVDFGDLILKLEPTETIIYIFFLKVQDGIYLKEIEDYKLVFENVVRGYHSSWEDNRIDEFVNNYTSIFNNNLLTQNISRINKKLELVIPHQICDKYKINGDRSKKYNILLDRDLVDCSI